ncbi:DUF998 domain-containing protein [Nakamurella lactea]|uniref:DUF998 domain-containing protein n=1 Tax=Nakamurella lactea TaxID=459515 RepID=UPI00048A864F|nr:DUF998 domain-containing protein [Nakamurella lactea]
MTILVVRRSGPTSGGSATWGSGVLPVALSVAVLALLAAQLLSGPSYDSTKDPLSGLEWTSQGWLFPVALMALAVGLCCAAGVVGAVRRWGSLPAVLLGLAGVGGAAAALYPSDPPDALVMTGVGEVHRWASTAVLVLPLVATLRVVASLRAQASLDPTVAIIRRRLVRLLTLTAAAGLIFLGGFLPAILHSDPAVLAGLTAVNGLSQRLLAILMVVCVWQLGRLARNRSVQRLGVERQAAQRDRGSDPTRRAGIGRPQQTRTDDREPVLAGQHR